MSNKNESKYLLPHAVDTHLNPIPLPVLLALCKVLVALFWHAWLVDLVFVFTNGTPHLYTRIEKARGVYQQRASHLQRVKVSEALCHRNQVWEIANG